MITDPANNAIVGDSFGIAIYLQENYPDCVSGHLFPEQTLDFTYPIELAMLVPLSQRDESAYSDYARFNTHIDSAFTPHIPLMVQGLPFDPASAESIEAEFVHRSEFDILAKLTAQRLYS
ncbi:hypothetical protein N7462_000911 [Penicillium macrosclerotiorum]|uniref:uncharacterized protein n=1 Tax=Penicillium macrosclerotiorum TaxID=303699 RepID=UPI002546C017|nr:uncharacterized protein N7462_000911 [Penicillium macrosclerotiorum]KAJ5698906.1 hypothetical protein N7462_000911 [Penicillium macrosclerotiorum]